MAISIALDLRNQTLLHRNAAGYYEFAHKSLAEYFVAFKFAAELGCLAPKFVKEILVKWPENSLDRIAEMQRQAFAELRRKRAEKEQRKTAEEAAQAERSKKPRARRKKGAE